jgi:FixJ family two-component response regulator
MHKDDPCVCVVDDDQSMRESLHNLLRSAGLNVQTFASAHEFLTRQRPEAPSCLVLDVQLPGLSGLELQQELAQGEVQLPIIFLTGHGDIPMTVRAPACMQCIPPHPCASRPRCPGGGNLPAMINSSCWRAAHLLR